MKNFYALKNKHRFVPQKAECDCSIASAAMYCQVSYEEIWRNLEERQRYDCFNFGACLSWKSLFRVVKDVSGKKLCTIQTQHFVSVKSKYKAILVEPSTNEGENHAVYWDGTIVMDPSCSSLPNLYMEFPKTVLSVVLQFEEALEIGYDYDGDWEDYFRSVKEPVTPFAGKERAKGLPDWRIT